MGKRNEARWDHWRSLMGEQRSSGLSVAEFCRRQSISAPSFYDWRRRLQADEKECSTGSFVSMTLPAGRVGSDALELQFGNGITLRIPVECDERALKRVLQVAMSLGADHA